MEIQDQCEVYAAKYEALGTESSAISTERARALRAIAHTWTILAYQFERLAAIIKKETN
jgi:hypothetical protein